MSGHAEIAAAVFDRLADGQPASEARRTEAAEAMLALADQPAKLPHGAESAEELVGVAGWLMFKLPEGQPSNGTQRFASTIARWLRRLASPSPSERL